MKSISLESEAGFKALFEYATIGILVVGKDGHIELMNPCAEKLFGFSNAELIGQPMEILLPGNLHGKHVHHREGYFAKPKARPMGLGMDLYARKKDGHIFPVEISLGHYEIEGNMLAVAFVSDITERKEMEKKLKKANEELEIKVRERTLELTGALEREKDLNEMKSRFVSMASHEFRTPLTTVLLSIGLVEQYKGEEHEAKRSKHFERIKSSITNLTTILNDFLSLDKLESGKLEVENTVFNMQDFLQEIVEEMQNVAKKKNQRINYVHNGHTEIMQDKKIFRNVMNNLLSNAIKYSPEEKEIHVSSQANGHLVSVSVKDNGIGIPEEEQKHLFNTFFRAKNAGTIQGTGLGLNIVKKYVELLDGKIYFTSILNKGTTFTVELPANKN